MKSILFSLLAVPLSLLAAKDGCKTFYCDYKGGTYDIPSEAVGTEGTANVGIPPQWCRSIHGVISVDANNSIRPRSGYLCLCPCPQSAYNWENYSYLIEQDGCPAEIRYSKSGFGHSGGEFDLSIQVEDDISWSFEDMPTWISCTTKSGKGSAVLHCTVAENTDENYRDWRPGLGIWITQDGWPLTVLCPNTEFPYYGGDTKISIDVNPKESWTAQGCSWITLSKTSGKGADEICATIAPNVLGEKRQSTIIVAGKSITIKQDGQISSDGMMSGSLITIYYGQTAGQCEKLLVDGVLVLSTVGTGLCKYLIMWQSLG